MPIVVSIASAADALGWRHALLILACERITPMLAALGLPEPIVQSPQPMLAAAQEFWRLDQELVRAVAAERAPTGPDERRLGAVALLNAALRGLDDAYPTEALGELVAWATRHYVDAQQRANLFIWSQVLLSIVLRGAAASLPTDQQAAFEDAVTGRIGTAPEAADKALVKAFEAAAPSPFETRLAEQQPELYDLARESLRETLRNQRTWRALVVLTPRLTDRNSFLTWARAQATVPGIQPDQLRWHA